MDKTIANLTYKVQNYNILKQNLVAKVKNELDIKVLRDISIPYDFDLNGLNYEIFGEKIKDKISLPISNNKFKELVFMPKVVINKVETKDNVKNNSFTQGMYLLGRNKNSKPILYSFSLTINKDNKNDFNIKFYAFVKGEQKMLARLDSFGLDHPVYLKDGKVVNSENDKIFIDTPHIHIASQEMEVLTENNKSYSHAYYVGDKINKNECIKNDTYLNKCMEYMLNLTNLKTEINYENLNNLYKCKNAYEAGSIFNEQTFVYGNNVNELSVYHNGIKNENIKFHFTKILNNFSFATRNLTENVEMAKINLPKSKHLIHKEFEEKNR